MKSFNIYLLLLLFSVFAHVDSIASNVTTFNHVTCPKLLEDMRRFVSFKDPDIIKRAKDLKKAGFSVTDRVGSLWEKGYKYNFKLKKRHDLEYVCDIALSFLNDYFGSDVEQLADLEYNRGNKLCFKGVETGFLSSYSSLLNDGEIYGRLDFYIEVHSEYIDFEVVIGDYSVSRSTGTKEDVKYSSVYPFSLGVSLSSKDKKKAYSEAFLKINAESMSNALRFMEYVNFRLGDNWISPTTKAPSLKSTRHLCFDGVPLYGNIDLFLKQMKAKGYDFRPSSIGTFSCEHNVYGVPDCRLTIYYNSKRNIRYLSLDKSDRKEAHPVGYKKQWLGYVCSIDSGIFNTFKPYNSIISHPVSHNNLNRRNYDYARNYKYCIMDSTDKGLKGNVYMLFTKYRSTYLLDKYIQYHNISVVFRDQAATFDDEGLCYNKVYYIRNYNNIRDSIEMFYEDGNIVFKTFYKGRNLKLTVSGGDRESLHDLLNNSKYSNHCRNTVLRVYMRQFYQFFDTVGLKNNNYLFHSNLEPIKKAYKKADDYVYNFLLKQKSSKQKVTRFSAEKMITVPILEEFVLMDDPEVKEMFNAAKVMDFILKALTAPLTPEQIEEIRYRRENGYDQK